MLGWHTWGVMCSNLVPRGPHVGVEPILRNYVGSRSYELKKNLDKTTEAELICYPPLVWCALIVFKRLVQKKPIILQKKPTILTYTCSEESHYYNTHRWCALLFLQRPFLFFEKNSNNSNIHFSRRLQKTPEDFHYSKTHWWCALLQKTSSKDSHNSNLHFSRRLPLF